MVVRVVAESPALEAVTTAAVAVAPATPPPPGATAASAIIVYPTQRRPHRNFRERILPAGCTGRGKVRGAEFKKGQEAGLASLLGEGNEASVLLPGALLR